jgi:hypothetical protein
MLLFNNSIRVLNLPNTKLKKGLFMDTEAIETIIGIKGKRQGNNYKISIPRPNLGSVADGFLLTPAMELELEVYFMPTHDTIMLMGEIAVLETELIELQKIFAKHNVTLTAIHNHFIRERPKIVFIHFQAMGDSAYLARIVRDIHDLLSLIEKHHPQDYKEEKEQFELDTEFISSKLGLQGKQHGSVYKVIIKRPGFEFTDHDVKMDSDSWITFQGDPEHAALAAEISLKVEQVHEFTQAAIDHDIEIAAIHNHMITEQPRIIFVHLWATGPIALLISSARHVLSTIIKI